MLQKLLKMFTFKDSPRRWYILHWASWLMGAVGVLMVLIAHGHYTIDVIIAYLVTTRLFWIYHTLANNVYLKVSFFFFLSIEVRYQYLSFYYSKLNY